MTSRVRFASVAGFVLLLFATIGCSSGSSIEIVTNQPAAATTSQAAVPLSAPSAVSQQAAQPGASERQVCVDFWALDWYTSMNEDGKLPALVGELRSESAAGVQDPALSAALTTVVADSGKPPQAGSPASLGGITGLDLADLGNACTALGYDNSLVPQGG